MLTVDTLLPTVKPEDPSRYLEEHVYFSELVSPNKPGYLSLDGQPWARAILKAVLDPRVH